MMRRKLSAFIAGMLILSMALASVTVSADDLNDVSEIPAETTVSSESSAGEELSSAEEETDAETDSSEEAETVQDESEESQEPETAGSDADQEEASGTVSYVDLPEIVISDRYQILEGSGEDTEKDGDPAMQLSDYTYDAGFESKISIFPESYKDALRRIHASYPNFTFEADYIDMTLDEMVKAQLQYGYKVYQWAYTSDYDTIYKFMDPLTYLYPAYDAAYDAYSTYFYPDRHLNADFFVFADQSYSSQYADALYYLVEGCDYLENEDMNSIITASAKYQMDPYSMASLSIWEKGWSAISNGNGDVTGRVVNKGKVSGTVSVYGQENGTKGSTVLGTITNADVYIVNGGDVTADGKQWLKIVYDSDGDVFDSVARGVTGFVEASKVTNIAYFNTYYNLFSVNQSDADPVVGGIAYAMNHGWTSRAASFEGGANFCRSYYYSNSQKTFYYMNYNVLNSTSSLWHEYAGDVCHAVRCARILRYAYEYDHSQSLVLHIPVYVPEPSVVKYNGVWTYVDSTGTPDYTYNGVASNDYGIWFIRNGVVDFNVNGVDKAGAGWYYFVGGKVQTDYTGIKDNANGWWRIVKGRVDFSCNSVEQNEYGWWYIKGGKVDFSYTGIAQNSYGWWRIVDGKVDFSCNSVEQNEYGWWYVEDGRVRFDYTGIKPNKNGWWRIVNGKVDFDCNSIEMNENGWWYLEGGKVQFGYNGIASNKNGWWKIVNGKVDFSCTDVQKVGEEWLYIQEGKVRFDYTGIRPNSNGWWRIVNGAVDFDCTSVEQNENGWWYVENGKVQFGYTGIKHNNYGWWRIENGQVNFNYIGLANNEYGWWYLKGGKVDFSYQGIVQNQYGYWYVQGGIVRFDYTGIAQGRYGRYYIENGKINWNYTGIYTAQDGTKYNIVEGEVQ